MIRVISIALALIALTLVRLPFQLIVETPAEEIAAIPIST
jgi:hypothetical protein